MAQETITVLDSTGASATITKLATAEDSAHASGDVGVMILAVRQDTQAVLAADADYIPLTTDSVGNLRIAIIPGQAGIAGGTGVTGATVPRVTLATDVALPAGTNAIGKLAANSGVDIGDVDVLTLPALVAGTAAIGSVKDNGPSEAGTLTHTVSANMTTTAAIGPAPTAGQKSVLRQIVISTDTTMNIILEEETSGTDFFKFFILANTSYVFAPRFPAKLATADKRWFAIASATGNVAFSLTTTSEA